MSFILQAKNVQKQYGGTYALRDAHFDLRPGEVHALVGENGAGKSTLAKIIAGVVRPDAGVISVDGYPSAIASPLDAQRLGIGIIYQELDLFPHLTAGENIVIGNLHFSERGLVRPRLIEQFCRPFLEQVGLANAAPRMVSALSIAETQLLAIARALSMNARIILMDEPTSSLFDDAARRLFDLIASLTARGVAIVYVSHKMDEIFRISNRITVLRDGQTVGTRDTAGTDAAEIVHMMVGREVQNASHDPRTSGEVLLSVENISTARLHGVSFELRRGEVLGIAGLVGSGRSELGAALFGIDTLREGRMRLEGLPYAPTSPRDAIGRGLGLVPEDRKLLGLMMQMSVLENSAMAAPGARKMGFLSRTRERSMFASVSGQLGLRCASDQAPVASLSGGNQQKTLLARWLLCDPEVLFLDDPARGIDVGAKQDVYRTIDNLAAAGKGIILVSSELPELLRCCDRVIVLNTGRIAAIYDAKEATQEKIMSVAAGASG